MSGSPNQFISPYLDGPLAGFPTEFRRGGPLPVDMVMVEQGDIDLVEPPSECFGISLQLTDTIREVAFDYGEGTKTFMAPGTTAYLNPTIQDVATRQVGTGRLLVIGAPLAGTAARLGINAKALAMQLSPLHETLISDRHVRSLCLTLWETSMRAGEAASLAIDHAYFALVSRALLLAESSGSVPRPHSGTLDAAALEVVTDFIESALERAIGLDDLVSLTSLSSTRFLAGFRSATGQTPHQYVLSRRIARAQDLLAAGDMLLAEVAYACGFASQSHMTDVFRQKLGVTPGRYRKEVRR